MLDPGEPLSGTLHVFVAFDWGDEILLEKVAQLVPTSVVALPRRRRTPSSISYHLPPLRMTLEPVALTLPHVGVVAAQAELTLFDFGAVSLSFQIPFCLPSAGLRELAGALADPAPLLEKARSVLLPLHTHLLPTIVDASWQADLSEEYFVFQFPCSRIDCAGDEDLLASLVHLENAALSADEKREATRLRLSYAPQDLLVADWTAAVLFDEDCDDTLQVIEFANLQLLEFRHIDNRLDDSLSVAGKTLQPLTRSYLPFWRGYSRPLRRLGALKMEANDLFERTGNALKLVGDPYLARVYRLLSARFHLETWEENIRRKLEVLEGVYQTVSDQASHFRTEFLEVIVVLLIVLEVILALRGH
ncbi:MAG: hypothetical protein U0793_01145 [Gemmataceae bacterium]